MPSSIDPDLDATVEDRVRAAVTAAIWAGAEEAVGAPEFASDEWLSWREDPVAQVAVHLEAVRLAGQVRLDPRPWVANARAAGVTWQQLADVLGMTRQGAQQRFAGAGDPVTAGRDDGPVGRYPLRAHR